MGSDMLEAALNNPLREKYHLNILFGDINKNPNFKGFSQYCDPVKHQSEKDIEELFNRHKENYKNYGFATGHEGLADIDFDWFWVYLRAKEYFKERLDTFTVRTPNGGSRVLIFTDSVKNPENFKESLKTELHFKKYVVCYGEAKKDDSSIGKYEVIQDTEIRTDETMAKDVMAFLSELHERYKFLSYPCIKSKLPHKKNHLTHEQRLAISNFIIQSGITIPEAAEFFSICPDYDKEKSEYQVSDTATRIKNGSLNYPTCESLQSGFSFDKELCKGCPRKKEKTKSACDDGGNASRKEKQGNFTISQAMEFQNWGYNGRIVAPLSFDKEIDGRRTFMQFIVYFEDGRIKEQRIASAIFIPPTGPTPNIMDLLKNELRIQDIYEEFYRAIDRHVYFVNGIEYKLMALGAMSTYFREVFNSLPYFDFYSATPNVGKTQAMLTLIWLSYCGFNTVNPTESILFRAVDESHAAIGIDEIGKLFKNPKENREILSLLLSGYKKGLPAYRMNMDVKPPRPVAYDAFGMKAFTRKEPIPRDLENRAITFFMMANNGRKVILQSVDAKEFSHHRDLMYAYRLKHWEGVKQTYSRLQGERVLDGRIGELYNPLLTIAKLISDELYDEVLEYAKGDQAKKSNTVHDESFVTLVGLLWGENYEGDVKVVKIRDNLRDLYVAQGEDEKDVKKWLSSQWVTSKLKAMGFERSLKRAGNYYYYRIDRDRLKLWVEDLTQHLHSKQSSPKLTNDSGEGNFSQNKVNLNNEIVNFDTDKNDGAACGKLSSVNFDSYSKGRVGSENIEQSGTPQSTELSISLEKAGRQWGHEHGSINSANLTAFTFWFCETFKPKWQHGEESGDYKPSAIQGIAAKIFKITPEPERTVSQPTPIPEPEQTASPESGSECKQITCHTCSIPLPDKNGHTNESHGLSGEVKYYCDGCFYSRGKGLVSA